jgi:hypothetical protein
MGHFELYVSGRFLNWPELPETNWAPVFPSKNAGQAKLNGKGNMELQKQEGLVVKELK